MADADPHRMPKRREDGLGYRPTWTGDPVTRENAKIEAIDPERQRRFEAILWELRQVD